MILESLNQTNIGSLNLEEPVQRNPFDPENYLGKHDREIMVGILNSYRIEGSENWVMVATTARDLKILFPDRVSELELDDHCVNGMFDRYRDITNEDLAKYKMNLAANLKILFPERFAMFIKKPKEKMRLDALLDLLQQQLVDYGDNPIDVCEVSFSEKILFPDRKLRIESNEEMLQAINDRLNTRRTYDEVHEDFTLTAAYMRLSLPERFKQLHIEKSELKILLDEFTNSMLYSKNENDIKRAMSLKILAAEEANITDRGLEIIIGNPNFGAVTPALPEVRKF